MYFNAIDKNSRFHSKIPMPGPFMGEIWSTCSYIGISFSAIISPFFGNFNKMSLGLKIQAIFLVN